MSRLIYFSFFLFVIMADYGVYARNEYLYRKRFNRDLPSIGEIGTWFKDAKDDVAEWGSDKYEEMSDKLEEEYSKLLSELEVKKKQLMNLPLYKDVQKLEHDLLTKVGGIQDIKKTVGRSASTLNNKLKDKVEMLQNYYEHNSLPKMHMLSEVEEGNSSEEAEASEEEYGEQVGRYARSLDDNMKEKLERVQNFYKQNPLEKVQKLSEDNSSEEDEQAEEDYGEQDGGYAMTLNNVKDKQKRVQNLYKHNPLQKLSEAAEVSSEEAESDEVAHGDRFARMVSRW